MKDAGASRACWGSVERPDYIKIEALDIDGEKHTYDLWLLCGGDVPRI